MLQFLLTIRCEGYACDKEALKFMNNWKQTMRFMRPPATIDKSRTTLCSMSSNTMVSGSSTNSGSSRTRTTATSDSNNNLDDEDDGIESLNRSTACVNGDDDGSSSEFSFNECDITLIDDEDILCEAKTDGEMLYCQVVEMLRFEVEVCGFVHLGN